MKEQAMTIGMLAKAANVGVETIRFYERKHIIDQPSKTNGFRYYSQDDVRRVRLIKKLQEIGFSLTEIKDFLVFDHCCSKSKHVVREKSQLKIVEMKQKIADLNVAVSALDKFMNACGAQEDESNSCDLLECFENDWECCKRAD